MTTEWPLCRACGKPRGVGDGLDADKLCTTCYLAFKAWAKQRWLDPRLPLSDSSGWVRLSIIDFDRPDVAVTFDEWLESRPSAEG